MSIRRPPRSLYVQTDKKYIDLSIIKSIMHVKYFKFDEDLDTPNEGEIMFDTTLGKLKGYLKGKWHDIRGAS